MKRLLATSLLVASLFGTCANKKFDRLEQAEKDHYTALKVWMDKKERKAFLKLKTRDERDAWLRDNNLWERFYQYDDRVRELIVEGNVKIGFEQAALLMAWGPAHVRKKLVGRPAARAEMFTYFIEVTKDGQHLFWTPASKESNFAVKKYRKEVILHDGIVAEINEQDGWE